MIKLVAIDLDGTLLNSEHHVSQRTKQSIKKALDAGISIVICTGRPVSGVVPLVKEIGLNSDHHYFVLNNGCSIHQGSELPCIKEETIQFDDVLYLYGLCKEVEGVDLALTLPSGYYLISEDVPDFVARDAEIVHTKAIPISIEEIKEKNEPIYLGMFMAEKSLMDGFQAKYETELNQRFSTTRSQPYIFENLPKGINKASSLSKLANRLGVKSKEVMALGDADNDIPMLEYADYSVAMGNATDEVKAICKFETASNDEDGVAKAIENFALGINQGSF